MVDEGATTHAAELRHQPRPAVIAAIVVLFLVAVGVTLHYVRTIPPGGGSSVQSSTGTTVAAPTTTTTVSLPKSRVTVEVANGTSKAGLAATYADALTTRGWDVLTPINGPTERHTVIYYREGFGHDAALVAGVVKATRAEIHPWSLSSSTYAGDDIVVILGLNAAN